MQAIKVRGHVGHDGLLRLEIPVGAVDQDIEAMVVVQINPVSPMVDDTGMLPPDFFDVLDRMPGEPLLERPDQGFQAEREPIE